MASYTNPRSAVFRKRKIPFLRRRAASPRMSPQSSGQTSTISRRRSRTPPTPGTMRCSAMQCDAIQVHCNRRIVSFCFVGERRTHIPQTGGSRDKNLQRTGTFADGRSYRYATPTGSTWIRWVRLKRFVGIAAIPVAVFECRCTFVCLFLVCCKQRWHSRSTENQVCWRENWHAVQATLLYVPIPVFGGTPSCGRRSRCSVPSAAWDRCHA